MSKRTDALVVAAMAASGGVIGEVAVGGGVAGTVAGGLIPLGVHAADRLGELAVRRRRERQGMAVEAAGLLDAGVDVFDERRADHDERVELLARVLEAAGRSSFEAKIQALGLVLRDGLSEGGDVGEAMVLAAGLAVVEPPHVVVLRYLHEHPQTPTYNGQDPESEHRYRPGWRVPELSEALPELAVVLDALLAVLGGQGLARSAPGESLGDTGVTHWAVSPLGRRCLFLLDGIQQDVRGG
jgi:hypothetical protein